MPPIKEIEANGNNGNGLQVSLVGHQDDGRALYVAQPEAPEPVDITTPSDTFEVSLPLESSPNTFGDPVALREYAARVQALKAAQRFEQYQAQPGDTVYGVLLKAGFSQSEIRDRGLVEQVARDSGLANPNLVSPGRALKVPVRISSTAQMSNEKPHIPYNPVIRPLGPITFSDPGLLMKFAS